MGRSAIARSRQQLDELLVGFREAKCRKILAGYPLHFLSKQRARFAQKRTSIEIEGNSHVRIRVGRVIRELADLDLDVKFFSNLPLQPRRVAFVGVDLATRELPQSGEMHARLSPRDKEVMAVFEDGGNDDDRAGFQCSAVELRHERFIGHAGHRGERATQIIAPRSMRA